MVLDVVPVRGVVLKGNKAIELRSDDFAKIWFHPDAGKGNASAEVPSGDIAADGTYKLFTRGQEGAPPGWYRVALVVNRTRDAGHPNQKRKSLIPVALGDPRTSGQALRVVPDAPAGAYEIRLPK